MLFEFIYLEFSSSLLGILYDPGHRDFYLTIKAYGRETDSVRDQRLNDAEASQDRQCESPCCIACIPNEYDEHNFWLLLMVYIRQSGVIIAGSSMKKKKHEGKFW